MPHKATHSSLKAHNRRLVLHAVFTGEATSRAALAQHTGLTKPTISDIVSDLIQEGYFEESGRGTSTESGGKRPRLLQFVPTARQVIGVSVSKYRVLGVLANLDGSIVLRHDVDLNGATGEAALNCVQYTINGLLAQLDAPLLCIGVGTPGIVEAALGSVRLSRSLGWRRFPLGQRLEQLYDAPVYVGNNTELATRAQLSFDSADNVCNLVTILVNSGIEIGVAFDGTTYHHSGDLGQLRTHDHGDQPLVNFLSWDATLQQIAVARPQYPDTLLPDDGATYLHLSDGYAQHDPLSQAVYETVATHLGQVFAWIAGLLRPDQIVLAGDIVDLGEPLLALALKEARQRLSLELLDVITFSIAEDPTLSVSGTIALALHSELGVL